MGVARAMMPRAAALLLLPLAGLTPTSPAVAQARALDLPAGPLGVAIDALARQAGASIVLSDGALWSRRVPAVRGRMSTEAAARLLARHAGVDARRLGDTGWRLSPRRPPPGRPHLPAATPPTGAPLPIGDVVVMASKRAAPISSLAGSVEIIALPPVGIDAGSAALVSRSTILSSTYRGAGREKLFIGGVADSSFSGRRQSVTGLYLGDVRLTYGSVDPDLQLHDVASVEVMQGPQGALYGSGSLGGVVRINPRMPVRDATSVVAEVGVSAIRHGAIGGDANAVVNVPLSADLSLRAVGYVRNEGGFIDRPALGRDVNRTRIAGGRAAVRWWAGEDWTVDATAIAQSIHNRDAQFATIGEAPLTDLGTIAEPSSSDYRAAHVVLTGRIGDVTLVSATGLSSQQARERAQFQLTTRFTDIRRRDDLVTHETRLSRGGADGWVVGIAYAGSSGETNSRDSQPSVPGMWLRARVDEAAVFGEGSVRLTSFLSIGAGARAVQAVSRSRQVYTDPTIPQLIDPRRRTRWLLPSVSLRLRPRDDLSVYARYQQGRRAEVSPQNFGDRFDESRPEVVGFVDTGVRWTGRAWRASASFQRMRWNGLRIDALEGFAGSGTYDLGDWSLHSINAAVSGQIAAGLRFDAAVTTNAAHPIRRPFDATTSRLPDIPRVIARGALSWLRPVGRDVTLSGDIWARYNGVSAAVFGPLLLGTQGDYTQTGVTVAVDRRHDGATLSVDTLPNTRGRRYLLSGVGRVWTTETPLRPLTVRLAYRRCL